MTDTESERGEKETENIKRDEERKEREVGEGGERGREKRIR